MALDVKTLACWACASYPTFDMNRYKADDSYNGADREDKTSPQYNRALDGSFTPGSVFAYGGVGGTAGGRDQRFLHAP